MKFSVASDIHLESGNFDFTVLKNNGVDCLVLAGDIVEFRLLKKKGDVYKYVREFFEYVSSEYDTVIWVPGNHEYYKCYSMQKAFDDANFKLSEWNLTNVHLLNNWSLVVGGVNFHCTTLWTDFNKNNPMIELSVAGALNDYKYIRGASPNRAGSKINTREISNLNRTSKEYLRRAVSDELPCVVVTHHQPLMELLDSTYCSDMDYAYANTDLCGFLMENDNIKCWVSGHTHSQFDVTLGEQRFITNCRGYVGDSGLNSNFSLGVIEV